VNIGGEACFSEHERDSFYELAKQKYPNDTQSLEALKSVIFKRAFY
jgi:hypothetical protein